jgi:hypothetical protein
MTIRKVVAMANAGRAHCLSREGEGALLQNLPEDFLEESPLSKGARRSRRDWMHCAGAQVLRSKIWVYCVRSTQ